MTLQEIYDKVMASDELKKSFAEAAQDKGKLEAWLKANGSDATVEQVGEFLKSKSGQTSGEVSDDELESVAGGSSSLGVTFDTVFSVGTFGMGCAGLAIASEAAGDSASDCFH